MATQRPPRIRWTDRPFVHKVADEWPLLVVLAGVLMGIGIMATGHWRMGSTGIGLAVTVGAVLRLVLPRESAKLLAVRSKLVDVIVLFVGGLGILALAWIVPPQR